MGLINAWLCGISMANNDPSLADKALAGELPVLPWKGGIPKRILRLDKIGSLQYLAALQGLRGEDLNIEQGVEVTVTCSRFGVPVLFTDDIKKLLTHVEGDET